MLYPPDYLRKTLYWPTVWPTVRFELLERNWGSGMKTRSLCDWSSWCIRGLFCKSSTKQVCFAYSCLDANPMGAVPLWAQPGARATCQTGVSGSSVARMQAAKPLQPGSIYVQGAQFQSRNWKEQILSSILLLVLKRKKACSFFKISTWQF